MTWALPQGSGTGPWGAHVSRQARPRAGTRRGRRVLVGLVVAVLVLVLAAPGFLAVFGTTYHHNFFAMLAGFVLFGAAVAFRALTEPLFLQAAADTFLPTPLPSHQKDSFDA